MQLSDYVIDPASLAAVLDSWQPLAFVDLGLCDPDAAFPLPAFPVIALGDAAHPLASRFDAVLEPPVPAAALIRQCSAAPQAAAALVHLLRSTEGLLPERALLVESFCYGLLQGSAEHAAWLAAQTPIVQRTAPGRVQMLRDDAALHIVIDRPWARNAIDRELRDQLHEAFTLASLDPDITAVTLRATGPMFGEGGDLEEFGTTRDPAYAHLVRARTLPAYVIARCADRLDVHVQGGCVGAAVEMAAFARRVTASADAWFHLPELAMGVIPGAGGCVSVPRRIGRQRAALMILSGKRIGAATALEWGLIDAIMDAPPVDPAGPDVAG